MAIAFVDAGAGVSTETIGAALSPANPATVNANDILIIHAYYEGVVDGPSTPTGFTLLGGSPYTIQTTVARHWVFGKIADGTEDGAANSLGTLGLAQQRGARVYRFSGWVSGTITQITGSFAHLSHATDPQMPTVTTTTAGGLAVALVGQNDNNAQASATGETGGDWVEAVAEYVAALTPGLALQLQTATPTANPGTISGGASATGNDPVGVIGFAIHTTANVVDKTDSDSATLSELSTLEPITVTVLDEFNDPTDGTSYDIGSNTLANNKLYLLAVYSGHTAGGAEVPSSISGTHSGLTWVEIASEVFNGGNQRVTLMRALGSAVSSGTIVINFSGTQHRVMAQLFEINGVNRSGANGSGAIAQSKTNEDTSGNNTSFSLDSAPDSANAVLAVAMTNSSITFTVGSGYTEVGTQASGTLPSMTRFAQYDLSAAQTVAYTTDGTPISGTVALELRTAVNVAPVDKSDSDSFALAEAATLTATATGTEQPTLAESVALSAATAGSDGLALTETGSGSATLTHSDTGAMADSTYVLEPGPNADAGTVSDGTGTVSAAAVASDASAVGETYVLDLAGTDSTTGGESVTLSSAAAGSDSFTHTEGGPQTALEGTDSATLGETGVVTVAGGTQDVSGSDTITFGESATLSVTLVGSDSATQQEVSTLAAAAVGTDSHTLAETGAATVALSTSDTLTFADVLAAFAATLPASDPFTLTESGEVDIVDLSDFNPADRGKTKVAVAATAANATVAPTVATASVPNAGDKVAVGGAGGKIAVSDNGRSGA